VRVPVTVSLNPRSEYYTVEVKSAPAISGTIFDPNGERVAGVHMQAFRMLYTVQGPRMRSVISGLTDDLGDFRLYWLRAGEYYVSAGWSDREQRIAARGLRLTPNLSKPDEGLPTMYFGQTYNPSEAQKVRLGRDTDLANVQIFLNDGPRYTISGVFLPEGSCARVAIAQEGGYLSTDVDSAPRLCGSFRIPGLSRGNYSILATNDQFASELIRVTTVNPVTEVKVPLFNTVTVNGRVSRDGARGLPVEYRVRLSRSSSDVEQNIEALVNADGSFSMPGVGPGDYDVSIQPLPERTFVRAITYRALDSLFTPISINSAIPGTLDIQLGQSTGTAEGIVVDRAGSPVPGAEVVLVPREARSRRRADRYLIAMADAGGNFRINGIPPVDYTLLAFEEIESQAYFALAYDLALFNRYTAGGQPLNPGGTNNQLRVIALPEAETAGGLR
ncbi:MAG TPA: carboxypeptidase-like regulatory domain-containing protein, partial [Terriglobia bacterium]|nr:carboxypeptidase-like regulatory domain-containing protein [Terriglobia bacterium]